jgi:response regulator RpfG family c-di-GMP phosphodiesterase
MPEPKPRVLFVDDEVRILDSFRTGLRKQYRVDVAVGPEAGLERVTAYPHYAVIVSDLKMPGMDGIEFLSRVAELSPDSSRVMLTGHGDLEAAVLAVNRGKIFRFLNKPTPMEEMRRVLEAGVRQFRLVRAEKELLRGTLRGALAVLTDILAVVSPRAFGRSERIKRMALRVGAAIKTPRTLELELAAMLSQLGCVILPPELLERLDTGEPLDRHDLERFAEHPAMASRLLARIPRLGSVAEAVARQLERYDEHPDQPQVSRILHAVQDMDALVQGGMGKKRALKTLREREGRYDPEVLDGLALAIRLEEYDKAEVEPRKLERGMILEQSLKTRDGVLLVAQGQEITEALELRVHHLALEERILGPVQVLVRRRRETPPLEPAPPQGA